MATNHEKFALLKGFTQAFAEAADEKGQLSVMNDVLTKVQEQLDTLRCDMVAKGVSLSYRHGPTVIRTRTNWRGNPVDVSIYAGKNAQTEELRNIAHSLVRIHTANANLTAPQKEVIAQIAFDNVAERHDTSIVPFGEIGGIHFGAFEPKN